MSQLPRVIADGPLDDTVQGLMQGHVELLPWEATMKGVEAAAIYTYGHPRVDGPLMERVRGLKLISNYGVGVDHINLEAAKERGIPVANTPGILDGATADMAFTLMLAAARR